MVRLTNILEKVKGYHPRADTDLINKAYVYASRMHDGQTRKSGDEYFIHPVSVADIIADMRLDASSVCAALLHDVVEDCEVGLPEVKTVFGDEVAFLVDGVTKLGKVNFASREDRQAESFRKMLVAMARDIRVLLVKLADRLDNMRTLEHMSTPAQERIARETIEIYAPLAGRLGIQWLKAELEDLSFKYLEPEAYSVLDEQVRTVAKNTDSYMGEVTTKLNKMLLNRGFSVKVSGRRKHLYSLHRKMKSSGIGFEQVHDFVAFRVITESVADCYATLGVIHSEWTPVPGRFKDYIALPKSNMYQSLHTTVIGPGNRRVEIQIRTHEMHRTADYGIAAHWQYKEHGGGIDPKDAARFVWLRQLMEFQKEVVDPEEFYESVKVDLFPEDVYVFTPKGDVMTFPRGATPVDFAYAVHSEVGHRCSGARVNGAIVPLRHKLQNGDVIEILTSKNHHPSKDWLEFVITSRARSRIRLYLRAEERKHAVKLGKELLEKEMRKNKMSLSRFLKSKRAKEVLSRFHAGSEEDLYARIGIGKLALPMVMQEVMPSEDGERDSLRPGFLERAVQRVSGDVEGSGIRIQGMDNMLVRFAQCCNPVPGDPVTGWITRGRGVSVHRRGCPRVLELDSERRVQVSWADHVEVDLPVSLRVMTDDRAGILASVSSVFSTNGVSISEASCLSKDGRAENMFHFRVGDIDRLREIMRGVAKVKGVLDVERV
ncbi:MAG: bifunctional (p)ppGpp synthetase/guanosine-3',5'-bis(diphosphate) 3'-pyrophosphohydrolase [Deltaproteobacteria bacterium]|nr:bifunctional (p)ppGpp synthetase/guanosine-3',5'-bis(diphosphate) 3'-pyrophosphohydrolase [Deltaproteobacteria bacterium]NND28969.1 bifunctional (p)ppGpp synthetase/guanosine-3',5'-bis(diphosphate) 3'-pyrophosphohydrolase [Myxococcales bacterium]MBT8466016.1 bifunctional (p)ppGpp synthetase/guanosine-3',5'-bis(diphosphate) 3'-pyrophosphohydrolase [Deltaproteobacteria bacterium]NNK07950.1 bifunctional (p)ppGpp synthetase/guanosine-3',5'-bis(diphosphate) 3'-pyrophosphohydrolase [Myxococcales ba